MCVCVCACVHACVRAGGGGGGGGTIKKKNVVKFYRLKFNIVTHFCLEVPQKGNWKTV